jgi:hypothetical protein
VLIEIDSRLAPADLPGQAQVPLPVPRLFRSPRLEPAEVPNAFSELVLLEL